MLRPENALQKANGSIEQGNPEEALDLLRVTLIRTPKNQPWESGFEILMMKITELCVQLHNLQAAKEAFYHYKILFSTQTNSLDKVMNNFLQLAQKQPDEFDFNELILEQRLEEERPENHLASLYACGGLSISQSDDERILKYYETHKIQEKFSYWFNFLWGTYVILLDTVKFYIQLENMYMTTAKQAFDLCIKYNRKKELKKLCDTLRTNFSKLEDYQDQRKVSLSDPKSLAKILDIQLFQLDATVKLSFWEETFKTLSGIANFCQEYKLKISPEKKFQYYDHFANALLVTKNYFYHAQALRQMILTAKSMNKKDPLVCTKLLFVAVSIPYFEDNDDFFQDSLDIEQRDEGVQKSFLKGDKLVPKELFLATIMNEIGNDIYPEFSTVYSCFNGFNSPFEIGGKMSAILSKIKENKDLNQYYQLVEYSLFFHVFQHLEKIYRNIRISDLNWILPDVNFSKLQQFILEESRKGKLSIKIDHQLNMIFFQNDTLKKQPLKNHISVISRNLFSHLDSFSFVFEKNQAEIAKTKKESQGQDNTNKPQSGTQHKNEIIETIKNEKQMLADRNSSSLKLLKQKMEAKKKKEEEEKNRLKLQEQKEKEQEKQQEEREKEEEKKDDKMIQEMADMIKKIENLHAILKNKYDEVQLPNLSHSELKQLLSQLEKQLESKKEKHFEQIKSHFADEAKHKDIQQAISRKIEHKKLSDYATNFKTRFVEAQEQHYVNLIEKATKLHAKNLETKNQFRPVFDDFQKAKQELKSIEIKRIQNQNKQNLENKLKSTDQEIQSIQTKIKESPVNFDDLNQQLKQFESEIEIINKEKDSAKDQMEELKNERKSLEKKLKKLIQGPTPKKTSTPNINRMAKSQIISKESPKTARYIPPHLRPENQVPDKNTDKNPDKDSHRDSPKPRFTKSTPLYRSGKNYRNQKFESQRNQK
ncbi:eukaryotic translation initiation factor 3 subunit a [Anaeramoeba ignava]|uniref:Eukaryotic translation initiation factor 3 subunit a n=1 Tax=Anaeramoeba ignava TaxID=1746090 RepID=A0A9Q0LSQ0_ANAIG|nr:eukaryotic translation initiation factor 3 subunit a [Anaeramoeba ignava]